MMWNHLLEVFEQSMFLMVVLLFTRLNGQRKEHTIVKQYVSYVRVKYGTCCIVFDGYQEGPSIKTEMFPCLHEPSWIHGVEYLHKLSSLFSDARGLLMKETKASSSHY